MGTVEQDGQRLAAAERRAHVVRLRHEERLTYREIGDHLGVSRQQAHRIFNAALAAVPAAAVEALRAEQLDELAEARHAVMEVLRRKHVVVQQGHIVSEIVDEDSEGNPVYGEPLVDDGPTLDAARTLVALQAREARLVGADAPEKVQTTVDGGLRYEVVGVDPADVG